MAQGTEGGAKGEESVTLIGILETEISVWEYNSQTCIAIHSTDQEATDVIVRVFYRRLVIGISQDKPQPIWLSKEITIPVYHGISTMGDCVQVRRNEIERIEVRWLKELNR